MDIIQSDFIARYTVTVGADVYIRAVTQSIITDDSIQWYQLIEGALYELGDELESELEKTFSLILD